MGIRILSFLIVLFLTGALASASERPSLDAAERLYASFNRYRAMARETKDVRGKESWEARQLLRQYGKASGQFRTYAGDYAEVLFPDEADVSGVRRMRTAVLATVFGYDKDDWRENFVDYVTAVAMAESKFDARVISWVGARGVMQVMPGTAKDVNENLAAARMRVIPSHADKTLSAQVMQGMEYLSWMICEAFVRQHADDLADALRMNPAQRVSLASKDAFFALYAYVRNGETKRVHALVGYLRAHVCDQLAALRVCRIAAAMYNAGQYHAVIAGGDVPQNGQTDFYVSEVVAFWNRSGMARDQQAALLANVLRRKHEIIVMRFEKARTEWTDYVVLLRQAYPKAALHAVRERLAKKYRLIRKDLPV